MIGKLFSWLGGKDDAPVPISDALWNETVALYPFLDRLDADERRRLRDLSGQFLVEKEFSAAGGLVLDDRICLEIAIQGCLPILNLGHSWYRGWDGVIIYPDEFVIPREIADPDGVVHRYDEVAAGEAWSGGPLIVSWHDVQMTDDVYNVVIHEFAHKIDMLNGDADGFPRLHRDMDPAEWHLLWLDTAIDGVKTGHTETAGFCLVASRHDGARRLTAVVVGTANDNARVQETLALLHYGSRAYDAVKLYDKGQALTQLKIFKGTQPAVGAGFTENFVLSLPKGVAANPGRLKVEVTSRQPLLAPVKQGDAVATLRLTVDGQPQGEVPLVALADVPVAGLVGRTLDSIKLWFQ